MPGVKSKLLADREAVPPSLAVVTGSLPADLKTLRQWILWRWEFRQETGKWTKLPVSANDGRAASTTDPRTWAAFDVALAGMAVYRCNGLGFVFTAADPYFGLDIDDCRDPESGLLTAEAKATVLAFSTYCEVSPSGTGVKLIGRGKLPPGRRRKGDVEVYETERYFALTGRKLQGMPANPTDCQAIVTKWHAETFPAAEPQPEPKPSAPVERPPLKDDDRDILERAKRATNGSRFWSLFASGDTGPYRGDDSAADLALCDMLAFWFGPDENRIDRLFRQSGLMRPKWDSRRGETTYGAGTIREALRGRTEFYGQRSARRQAVDPAPPPKVVIPAAAAADDGVILVGSAADAKAVQAADWSGYGVTVCSLPDDSPAECDLSDLAGRRVWLWPGCSKPEPRTGLVRETERFRDAAEALQQLAPPAVVRWVMPEDCGLSPGQRPADYAANYAPGAELRSNIDLLLGKAIGLDAVAEFDRLSEEIAAGRYKSVALPWPRINHYTRALLPGTVTLLCGPPGDGKSFWLLESVLGWLRDGIPTAIWELEEDGAFWVRRALAILAGNSSFTDIDRDAENAEALKAARLDHAAALTQFGKALTPASRRPPQPKQVTDWLRRHASLGARILCIDPVTAIMPDDRQHLRDFELMMDAKLIAREHRCSILFVTHPTKTVAKNTSPLERLAGGAAFTRFAQTVLCMAKHRPPREADILLGFGGDGGGQSVPRSFNRTVMIAKARNSTGGGLEVGFNLEGGTLRFAELGVIVEEEKGRKRGENADE